MAKGQEEERIRLGGDSEIAPLFFCPLHEESRNRREEKDYGAMACMRGQGGWEGKGTPALGMAVPAAYAEIRIEEFQQEPLLPTSLSSSCPENVAFFALA